MAVLFMVSAFAVPTSADTPGNWSFTAEFLVGSSSNFGGGVGIYDNADPTNAFSVCVFKQTGARAIQPASGTWEIDQNMGTNLNGPAIGISDLGLGKPGGIPTLIPCPPEIGGAGGTIFITWHGMNWRSAEHDSFTQLQLCTQKVFSSSSPGCIAFLSSNMRLWVSACGDQAGADAFGNVASRTPLVPAGTGNQPDWATANFGGDYTDAKGKYAIGEPFGTLASKSDVIKCPVRKTVDYTTTIQDFTAGGASQTFNIIKNEAVVHAGHGSTYMAVCWQINYLNFSNPLAPTSHLAQTHDWKLIIDLNDPDNAAPFVQDVAPEISGGGLLDAFEVHYTGHRIGDNSAGAATEALRGFYSQESGDPKDGGVPDGQNDFGPCQTPNDVWFSPTKLKNPTPII